MKKLCLFIFALFLFINNNNAQITATIGNVTANQGDVITIPVNVTGFSNVGAIGIIIPINTLLFEVDTLDLILNMNAKLTNSAVGSYGYYFDTNDTNKLKIFWYLLPTVTKGIDIASGKLFDLKLKFIGTGACLCFYNPTIPGFTGCTIADANGDDLTVDYSCGKIGLGCTDFVLNTNAVNTSFSFYPNPSNGIVNLAYNGKSNLKQISIYSLNGEKVYDLEMNSNNNQNSYMLNLSDLSKGMYVIKVLSKDDVIYDKLIIE